jgi:O-antigen ligase
MTALCGYLTFSRGGAIAVAVGLVAFVALAPERIPKLATMLAGAAGSAALIAGAIHRNAIEQGFTGSVARHQGASLIVAVILVCAGVGVVQVGIGLAARHGTLPRALRISVGRARLLLAAAVVAVLLVAVAVHVPRRLDHAWQQFKRPQAANLHQNALGRYGALSGNGRYTYWKVSVHAMPSHVGGGFGPGTFQLVWLPRAPFASYVRNAHSLYVETLTDVGVVGLVLLVGFFVVLVVRAVERVVHGGGDSRALAAGVAAVVFAFLTSAAFDWVWQIPVLPVAFLLLAAAVLAPGPAMLVAGRGAAAPQTPSALAAAAKRPALMWAARGAMMLAALAALVAIGVPLAATNALRQSQAAAAGHANAAALADARTAQRIEPGAASARLQAALVLEQEGRVTSALADARAATTDEPSNWQTWLIRSRLEAEAGHPRLAVSAFRRARTLNPQSPIFHG